MTTERSGSRPEPAPDLVDLTTPAPGSPPTVSRDQPAPGPRREPFDPAPHRERLRGLIAVVLVGLFALAILASLAIFWALPDRAGDMKDLLPLVLTPLTSVVSAVLGFYYGAQARRDD